MVVPAVAALNGAEHQVAGFRRVDGRLERLDVAQLADEDDVGILTHGVLECLVPVDAVQADLAAG